MHLTSRSRLQLIVQILFIRRKACLFTFVKSACSSIRLKGFKNLTRPVSRRCIRLEVDIAETKFHY